MFALRTEPPHRRVPWDVSVDTMSEGRLWAASLSLNCDGFALVEGRLP